MRLMMKKVRQSAIPALLFGSLALGWLVALTMPNQHAKEGQRQEIDDSGGQDDWFLPLTR